MDEPDIERAAEFLAAHAVLLLGIGILIAGVAAAAALAAIQLVLRVREPLLHAGAALVRALQDASFTSPLLTRTRAFVPGAYLALHLALGLVITTAAVLFALIAEEAIAGGDVAAFDVAFARSLYERRTPGWERLFVIVSHLGSREALAVGAVVVAVLLGRRPIVAGAWLAGQAGGGVLNLALKGVYERTRPEFADPMLAASSWSFPSGHAMGTFILWGLGCYLVLRERPWSWTTAAAVVTVTVAWCLTMAFSRLYLGVHYASDVVAGLIAGTAWVAVCASGLEVLRTRGHRVSFWPTSSRPPDL